VTPLPRQFVDANPTSRLWLQFYMGLAPAEQQGSIRDPAFECCRALEPSPLVNPTTGDTAGDIVYAENLFRNLPP
jgi:hypothetical protein